MSDSDEYEKIDVEDIEDKDSINDVSMQTTSSDQLAVVTEMEMSVDNPTEAENNEAVKSEETKSESNDSYLHYIDEELYDTEMFDTVSSSSPTTTAIAHEKSVQITNQKMKELKITTPEIIFDQSGSSSKLAASESNFNDEKLVFLKNLRKKLFNNFAETKQFEILAEFIKINNIIISMQGFNDAETLKSEPKPCSSKTVMQKSRNEREFSDGQINMLIDIMNNFYKFKNIIKDDNDRAKFREMHEEFLKIFLCKSGIENPVVEEEKMKIYCKLLQPSFEKMDHSLSACPFRKYLQPQKHVEHLDSSKNAMAQANPPPSKPSPLMDSKIEEALSASKSAQEEYIALLEERDKAYAEDPKDTQLHEHMTQLCLDALQKSEEAAEKYANLCAAAKSSSTTTSKLTVVTGPTYSIPPKSVPSSGLDKGADIIKQAEEKEANKNFPEALKLYSKAVDFYLHKIRYELKGAKAKENLRQKVQKCIIKYEKLKDYLLNHTNYETEKLMYLNNGTWPTTKLRYFTAFNQYQLYILLSHNVVEKPPTGIQTSIFEALKNGTFANEKLEALYSLNPIIVNAHKKMREAQEKCGDLLEEKGFAVLEDPQNKALKDDVMKCCCEIFEKWKTAKNKYANIAYFGTPDYGLGATHIDVSNDFGGEKAVEKPYLKSDEISKYDIDKICINNDSNTVNNALEEMKLVEGGNSESSNSNSTQNPSYSNSTENDDPFRIPEDIDLATKEEEQEHVYKLATFANIDPRVSRAYHKMIYVEARVNALQFVYSQQDGFGGCGKMYSKTPYHEKINSEATMKAIELLSNLDSSALKAKYSEAYNAAILELNEARTELQKCIEETRFFKHAPLTFMEFQEEKAKLDEWMKKLDPKTSSNPQESLKNPLSKPVTKREKMFEEAVQKIQNLKQNDKEVTISTPRPFNHSSDFPAASTESNNIQKHLLNPSKVNETNPTTAAASIKAKEMEVDNETAEKTNFNKKFNHKTQQTHLTHPPNEKEELEAAKWRVARQRNLNKFESNRKRGKRDVDEIAKTLSTTATASDALKTFTSGFALYPPTPAQTSIKILEKQLEEAIKNLKDTENSRKTLIEMNEVLKGQKEDFQAKYKSAKELNEYLENECKKLYKDFNEKEQKNVEEFEKGLLQKDATIVRLQTQLAQTKDELLAKNPKILVKILEDVKIVDEKQPKDSDSKFAEELIKVQKQLEYFKKLAADQAEALKNFELAKSLEKQLSHATEKADKAEKALRKREALDSSTQDLILKRFKDSDDDSPVV